MAVNHVLGIDLGATHSAAATISPAGHSEMIRDAQGNLLSPSVVFFDAKRAFVGEEALLRGATRPDALAVAAKRDLGQAFYHHAIHGEKVPPEVVLACVLRKLRDDAVARLGPELGVVLAAPAWFGELQRQALADAASMADLYLMDLVPEPLAAAFSFGEHLPLEIPAAGQTPELLLMFDWGGLACEISLIEVDAQGMRLRGTTHDENLGGRRLDERLANFFAEALQKLAGGNPRGDPTLWRQLMAKAERAKCSLTLRPQAVATFAYAGKAHELAITRAEFAKLAGDLVERALQLANTLLESHGVSWSRLWQVFLSGGTTRLPLVRERLAQQAGRTPTAVVNPEEAVARGAAIYAQRLWKEARASGKAPRFQVVNICTHSLGLEGVDPTTGSKVNSIVVPRGTPLPTKVVRKFLLSGSTHRQFVLTVLEGESARPEECRVIGKAMLRDLPADLNEQWPVDVELAYSPGGKLTVDARVRYTDRVAHLDLVRAAHLSPAKIVQWRELLAAGAPWSGVQGMVRGQAQLPPIALADSGGDQPEEATGWSAAASRYARQVFRALGWGKPSETNPS